MMTMDSCLCPWVGTERVYETVFVCGFEQRYSLWWCKVWKWSLWFYQTCLPWFQQPLKNTGVSHGVRIWCAKALTCWCCVFEDLLHQAVVLLKTYMVFVLDKSADEAFFFCTAISSAWCVCVCAGGCPYDPHVCVYMGSHCVNFCICVK